MRYSLLFAVFPFFSCGSPSQKENAPSGNSDSALTASITPSDTVLPFILLDTVELRTAARQILHYSVLKKDGIYFWVLGNDTIHGTNECDHAPLWQWADERNIVYQNPDSPIEEGDIASLGNFSKQECAAYNWIVRLKRFYTRDTLDEFARAIVMNVQLDNDKEDEKIVQVSESDWSIDYYILDHAANGWRTVGTGSSSCRWDFPDEVLTSCFPYFGIYQRNWGCAYSDAAVDLFRLQDDSIYEYAEFSQATLYEGMFPNRMPDSGTLNGETHFSLTGDRLAITYSTSATGYREKTEDQYPIFSNERVTLHFVADTIKRKFIPDFTESSAQWLDTTGGSLMFDYEAFAENRFRKIAVTGNKIQRKILEAYR